MLLTGPNGAGKTSLLEAVSLLSPGRGIRSASAEEIARKPDMLGWKVSATLEHQQGAVAVETFLKAGKSRKVVIGDKPARQLQLAGVTTILWLSPLMDRIWLEGADGRRKFLDRMAMSFFADHPVAVLGYEKAMRERNRLLRDRVSESGWYNALERQMATYGARIFENRRSTIQKLAAAFTRAETSFPTPTLEIVSRSGAGELSGESEDELASRFRQARSRDMAAGRTLAGPHRSDLCARYSLSGTDAKVCSTGEQKAMLISVILANARAIASETGTWPIILLDEVGGHLDSNRRRALYEELATLESQIWVTGTEAAQFEGLLEMAQHFDVSCSDGDSVIVRQRQSAV